MDTAPMRRVPIVLLFSFLISSGLAGGASSQYPGFSQAGDRNFPGRLAARHLSVLGIALGRDTFSDAMAKLGNAAINRAQHREFICYVSSAPKDSTAVVFETNDLGGAQRTIFVVIVAPRNMIRLASERCTSSSRVNRAIATESGIALGITKERVTAILGQPTYVDRDRLFYRYLDKRRMTDGEQTKFEQVHSGTSHDPYFDVTTTAEAHFTAGKLTWFLLHKIETY